MYPLPVLDPPGVREPSRPSPEAREPPWMHLLPGPRPLVLLVHGSQLYEVDPELFARLEAGEPEASVELRALSDAARPPEGTRTPLPAPASVSLNLAQACNLACHYCYADEGRFQGDSRLMPEHVALAAIDRALEEARGARITLGFIGGEPFLNRAVLHRSVAHARARAAGLGVQVGFSLTTNGTLLRPEDLELLRDNPFAVTVSLDGDAAMHDRHRPARDGRGSHARAMEALAPLLAAPGRARVVARATVTRDDLRVAERVAALLDAGFQEAGVSPVRTGPDAALPLRREDWGPFLAEMIRAAEAELTRVRARRGEEPLRFSNLGIALKEIHRGACRPLPCGAAQGYVSVSAEGRYFTCHRTIDDPRFALGDLSRGPDAGARKRFVLARHVDRQEPCRSCWARYLCGGGCHAEVVSAGREGCDYIRGWLEFCLRAHNDIASELPQLLVNAKEGAS